uniref:Glutamine amidotransferase domain-containing protein n=1 Tax=Salix viminalis TaxID=40686 RepID=A0A6N2M629_SALVM
MEPEKIDWKRINSVFVEDKLYESVNAPKWYDFVAPEDSIDDEAWFCRPDCNHPKTAEDFLKTTQTSKFSSSGDKARSRAPLSEKNQRCKSKRRGQSQSSFTPYNYKAKFNQDSENRNPNLPTPTSHHEFTKEMIKSNSEITILLMMEAPRLKSTLSARNLFAGKDKLGHITEFCNELKKMATRAWEKESLNENESQVGEKKDGVFVNEGSRDVLRELNVKEKESKPLLEKDGEKPEGNEKRSVKEKQRRKKRDDDAENMPVPLNLANVKSKGEELLLQIRTNPPSPQCFSANRAPAKTSTPSKASRSRLTVRGMLEESKDEEEIEGKVRSFFAADGRESRALDSKQWFREAVMDAAPFTSSSSSSSSSTFKTASISSSSTSLICLSKNLSRNHLPSKFKSRRNLSVRASNDDSVVTLLDYGAGNVRSVRNAIRHLGFQIKDVQTPKDILNARRLIFPGVGAFAPAMDVLNNTGMGEALCTYIQDDRPFLGICLGLQLLFESSEENGPVGGLGLIPGVVGRFDSSKGFRVPHIGWNALQITKDSEILDDIGNRHVYFVHSYRAMPSKENKDWISSTCNYGDEFIASVRKGKVHAVQFHPEKNVGLSVLRRFLLPKSSLTEKRTERKASKLAKRVIACLDVRTNDEGDLVVTKGDQYDVREHAEKNEVRNLGKPVELAGQYYKDGADEVSFLNITGFRDFPLGDLPMLQVLRSASENVFVPLTVGGGIRDFTDSNDRYYSSLEVASEYFRSGADKISIGSDAVHAAEEYLKTKVKTGKSSIEQISRVYGNQAVVVSIDPRRMYLNDPSDVEFKSIRLTKQGPNGEEYAWYQCTINGGREGQGKGFDVDLIKMISDAVSIPVIASSGAGAVEHFTDVFSKTNASAALAAGIFHRKEVPIRSVKEHLLKEGIEVRI